MEMRLLQLRDPRKAKGQGVSRREEGGRCALAWRRRQAAGSAQPVCSLLSTCWLGMVSPKQSDGWRCQVPDLWGPLHPPPTPHDGPS